MPGTGAAAPSTTANCPATYRGIRPVPHTPYENPFARRQPSGRTALSSFEDIFSSQSLIGISIGKRFVGCTANLLGGFGSLERYLIKPVGWTVRLSGSVCEPR